MLRINIVPHKLQSLRKRQFWKLLRLGLEYGHQLLYLEDGLEFFALRAFLRNRNSVL